MYAYVVGIRKQIINAALNSAVLVEGIFTSTSSMRLASSSASPFSGGIATASDSWTSMSIPDEEEIERCLGVVPS